MFQTVIVELLMVLLVSTSIPPAIVDVPPETLVIAKRPVASKIVEAIMRGPAVKVPLTSTVDPKVPVPVTANTARLTAGCTGRSTSDPVVSATPRNRTLVGAVVVMVPAVET